MLRTPLIRGRSVFRGCSGVWPGSTRLAALVVLPAVAVFGAVVGVGVGSPFGASLAAAGPAMTRLSGPDRYATAAAVAQSVFPSGAGIAYLATGTDFPDALAAAAAGGGRGPVLLTAPTGVPLSTGTALRRLHPAKVVVVGGPLAIPDSTLTTVRSELPSARITRVSGPDRNATAVAVSRASFPSGAPIAYVATGADYPDALSAAASSGGRGPILLVGSAGLPFATASELRRLHPGHVLVVGGTGVVPSATKAAIEADLPSADVLRASGSDRFSTAADLSSYTFPGGAPIAYLATGDDFPDALTAAAAAAGHGPVLLALEDEAPLATLAELIRLAPSRVVVVGGEAAISNATAARLLPSTVTAPPRTTAPTAPPTTPPPPTTTAPKAPTTTVPLPPAPPPSPSAGTAVQTAQNQIGKPYAFGGAGPGSFDCSGLTMFAWASAGVALPHDAAAQAALLAPVKADLAHLAPGDLIFYYTPITHVAIYAGYGQMIEAAHTGVPVRMTPFRTQNLVGAGRPEPSSS